MQRKSHQESLKTSSLVSEQTLCDERAMPLRASESRWKRHRTALVGLAFVVVLVVVFRQPRPSGDVVFVPTKGDQVLERLPAFSEGKRTKDLRRMREALASDPKNLSLAIRTAQAAIELGRARSDPRYLGQAEAALLPFWASADPPPATLTLRATIRQSLHDFEGALADLNRVVSATPDDVQAWLTRAVVLTVLARYDEARADCKEVVKRAPAVVGAVCEETLASLTGHAADAYARLNAATKRAGRLSPEELAWVSSTLGELAVRAGNPEEGRAHFVRALEQDPDDAYVLAAISDLDLDTGRAKDVLPRLRGKEENDMLLLRLALAEKAVGAKEASVHTETLGARFRASQRRGDVVHRREEARFRLSLAREPERALELAEENWKVQREVADARVLMEAALAAKKKERARPVMDFLERWKCEEPALVALGIELRK